MRIRPNKRGSRPRTKVRPAHKDALGARVLTVDRGRYRLLTDDGIPVRAMKARELGKASIVVGDRVGVVGDTSGAEGTLARVVRVEERSTLLRRSADDADAIERPIVANADQLVIVAAITDPPARPGMIDRCLAAATVAGMEAILCLTKADLADPGELAQIYREVGVEVLTTAIAPPDHPRQTTAPHEGICQVAELLTGRDSVLIGHSGVGKSTLVNALVPLAQRETGHVNVTTGRGRHTSSSAVAFELPEGGWVIDTPGVRSFGLAHLEPEELLRGFTELAAVAQNCPRGCTHEASSPDCLLDEYAQTGPTGAQGRVENFRNLLANRLADQDW